MYHLIVLDDRQVLTTFPQLNGNKYMMWDISRNSRRHVTKILKSVTNIIRRRRPTNGSIKSPTFTVPDVHKHAKQAMVVIYNKVYYFAWKLTKTPYRYSSLKLVNVINIKTSSMLESQ